MPYKHNEPRRHKIPKAKYKVANWWDYDRALQQRGSLGDARGAGGLGAGKDRATWPSYSDIVIETYCAWRWVGRDRRDAALHHPDARPGPAGAGSHHSGSAQRPPVVDDCPEEAERAGDIGDRREVGGVELSRV